MICDSYAVQLKNYEKLVRNILRSQDKETGKDTGNKVLLFHLREDISEHLPLPNMCTSIIITTQTG